MRTLRCVLLLCLAADCRATSDPCRGVDEFDGIITRATDLFYDKTYGGLEWSSRVAHHRAQVRCGDDAVQVARRANLLLGELRASHTAVYSRSDIDYWGLNSFFSRNNTDYQLEFAGIWPERRGERWFAKYVFEGSSASRAGIRQGDELLRLNGGVFGPLGFRTDYNLLVIARERERRQTLRLAAARVSIIQAFIDASAASRTTIKVGDKSVGYFHLWTARDVILQNLKSALTEFEAARVDALIIDLRGGYGGTSVDYLTPMKSSAYLAGIPKYFLIDDGVRSGKEMLAAIIKRDKLGTLVGSATAGAFLGARPERLFDERYLLLIAAYPGNLADLPKIEGVGVQPDVEVPPCRMRCAAPDAELTKALELLREVRGVESAHLE